MHGFVDLITFDVYRFIGMGRVFKVIVFFLSTLSIVSCSPTVHAILFCFLDIFSSSLHIDPLLFWKLETRLCFCYSYKI